MALIGLRCSGKTSVGRALAERLRVPFVDLDEALLESARAQGRTESSAGALLAAAGEAAFRAFESLALELVLAERTPRVLACGGGVVEGESNRAALRERALCVLLDAPDAVLAERLARERAARPALAAGESAAAEVARLRARRGAHYTALAALALDSARTDVDGLVDELAARLELVRGVGLRSRTA